MIKYMDVPCVCGLTAKVLVVGNYNANAKGQCECGRNITVHYRLHVTKKK